MGTDAAAGGLVVGLLGPVEIGAAGEVVTSVAQPRLRVLLGLLGAAGGRVVSAEALVDGVWGEEWSPGRERNLHALVYQLRRRLSALEPGKGGARLLRAGAGYRLLLGPDELDVAVFQDLTGRGREAARAGDTERARELFGQALGLWRGAALADAAPLCPRLAGEGARLEEARAGVVEQRVECDLTLGRHAEAVGELAGLVAEFPLRERLAALLMTALYRCGRRGEALAVFDTARRVLAEQLGLDPGPELTGLQAKVLCDDPALAAPALVVQAAAARTLAVAAVPPEAPAAAAARVVPLRQLVERGDFLASLEGLLGEALAGSGRLVLLGGEAGVGKTTLAGALAAAAAGLVVRRGCCDNVTTAEALGPLVDALPELAGVLCAEAGVSRFRLFQHVHEVLSASPMLLLLEDVHWADEATLEVLRFVGRRLGGVRMMILATFRSEEVGRDHPLTVVLGDLATLPGVVRMHLPPLTVTGVRQLLEHAGSALDVGEVYERTGGNPFYVTEVIATAREQVPATVRDAVLARVSALSPAGRDVVAAAAVLGRPAEVDLLAGVPGQPLAAVDECLRRGVLVADADQVGFRHELARLAVERSLSQAQRAGLHARAFAELTARGSGDDRRLAHHAAGCGDRAAVLRHAPLAADRAARLGAHREAAEQLQLALRYHDRPDHRRAVLLGQLSYEWHLTGQLERARSLRLEALEIYQRADDALAIGTSQRWLSRLSWILGQNPDAERYATAAVATLELLAPGRELAMAYSNLSQLRMLADDTREAVRWGRKAIELARRLGDRDTETHALNNIGTALAIAGDVAEGWARLAQSLDLALANGAHEHAARAYTNLGDTGVANRMFGDADRHLRAGIAYCADHDIDTWRLHMTGLLARSLAEQGQYAAADQYLADVLRHPNLSPFTRLDALAAAGALAARRSGDGTGALDEALLIAIHTVEAQDLVPVATARAEVAWIAGRLPEIAAEVNRAWPAAVVHPQPWILGELSWWLHVAGDHRQAPIPLARPFALMLAGEHRGAAEEWRALGCPLWQAYALARSPHARDAQECTDILGRLGASAVRRAVLRDRHARRLPVARGPRPASRAHPAGLTAREVEVLGLLADGLSYTEIAERLTLSEKTVGHHVSAVLRKLGEPTRSRAVAAAVRRGILTPN